MNSNKKSTYSSFLDEFFFFSRHLHRQKGLSLQISLRHLFNQCYNDDTNPAEITGEKHGLFQKNARIRPWRIKY